MQSEVVKIRVSKHMIKADCSFVFVNNGPACTVRMGFPDQASMPMHDPRKHIRGSFLSFSVFADVRPYEHDTDHRVFWYLNGHTGSF